jgi:drug/metabolite transporter (DMT)-like permease
VYSFHYGCLQVSPHSLGLLLASACAATNVAMDVLQKRALSGRPYYPTILSARVTVFVLLSLIVIARIRLGYAAPWQAPFRQEILHTPHFLAMLAFDCLLMACSMLLYYRAIQTAPLSLTIPFLTFTPAFLLLTSHIVLRERPTLPQVEGVAIVVFGSVLMYRSQFRISWLEPFRALAQEPGSRYMLLAALIMSLTNPLDKWLIVRSSSFTFAWLYATGSCVLFSALLLRRPSFRGLAWKAIIAAGVADATTLALQFASLVYLSAVVTICLKRSGILLTVLAGWLIFREHQIENRLIAAMIMVSGALMLYLNFDLWRQTLLSILLIIIGLYGPRWTRFVQQWAITYRP